MVELAKVPENRLRIRVPASVVVTLLGAALTVWLAPAFTRQWDDRKAARDLKVGLAEDAVITAFQTIQDGARLAEGNGAYDVILGRWGEAALKTELRTKAYFGSIGDEWQMVDQEIQYFLIVSQDITAIRERARYRPADERFRYRRDQISSWLSNGWAPTPYDMEGAPTAEDVEGAPTQHDVDAAASLLADDKVRVRAEGMKQVKTWILAKVETAADALLSAHPSGFSTTRKDLLDDLLP
jgi:hypothetical protein